MCKSLAEGGQRCAAHTRPAAYLALSHFERPVPEAFTERDDQAIVDFASTRSGREEIVNLIANRGERISEEAAAYLTTALRRGESLAEANREAAKQFAAGRASTVALEWDRDMSAHLMPIVGLQSGDVDGYEVLARWERNGIVVTPDVAFAAGADPVSTSRIALFQAVGHSRGLNASMSVNLPVALIVDDDFRESARFASDKSEVPRINLMVELLENEPLGDPAIVKALAAWREDGFAVALDDYGSGYANAETASRLRPTMVKTHMDLIQDGRLEELREAVLVAHSIGALVVVEGIETRQHAETARALGADKGQGWLFGRACPAGSVSRQDS